MLGSVQDAEDVLQEVYAAAYNAMLADERPINVRPWLYRIARNRSLNHMRKIQAVGVDSMDIHLSDFGATTADKVHNREDFRALVRDIGDLAETQRTALVLREMEALSYEQIAEAMETTVPSVKSLLVRARVSLAEAAEARLLTCEEVRCELGEVAEGLIRRPSPPVRRHLKSCKRCSEFQVQLKKTNKALAAIMPIGPLIMLRKLAFGHLGHSAGSGATAASSATATGAGASGTALGGSAVAGGAVAAGSGTGGIVSAGVGAFATKAAVGIAAAALMTAGAVAVTHTPHHRSAVADASARTLLVPLAAGVSDGTSNAAPLAAPVARTALSKAHGVPAAQAAKRAAADAAVAKALQAKKAAALLAATTTTPAVTTPAATTPNSTTATSTTPGRTDTTPIDTVLPTSTAPPGTTTTPTGTTTTPTGTTTTPTGTTTTPTGTTTTPPGTTTTPPGTTTTPTGTTTTPTTGTTTTPSSTTPSDSTAASGSTTSGAIPAGTP